MLTLGRSCRRAARAGDCRVLAPWLTGDCLALPSVAATVVFSRRRLWDGPALCGRGFPCCYPIASNTLQMMKLKIAPTLAPRATLRAASTMWFLRALRLRLLARSTGSPLEKATISL